MRTWAALAALTDLRSPAITNCNSITTVAPLARLLKLEALDISHCKALTDITALRALAQRGVALDVEKRLLDRLKPPPKRSCRLAGRRMIAHLSRSAILPCTSRHARRRMISHV